MNELDARKIVIVTGFQGVNKHGDYVTLGRGGSDTTAVALAAALHADKCEIYTDVDGVFTADPRVVTDARKIEEITYDEMLELATSGAKVLHNRAVSLAKKYKLKLKVKNTRGEKEGTIVNDKSSVNELYNAKILAVQIGLSKITIIGENMYSNIDYIWKIYNLAKEKNVIIYMISFSEIAINIIVDENVADEFTKALHDSLIK